MNRKDITAWHCRSEKELKRLTNPVLCGEQSIADMTLVSTFGAELSVSGFLDIEYKGQSYYFVESMPKELVDLIKNTDWENNPEIKIYEKPEFVIVTKSNGQYIEVKPLDKIVEISKVTPNQLKEIVYQYIKYIEKKEPYVL